MGEIGPHFFSTNCREEGEICLCQKQGRDLLRCPFTASGLYLLTALYKNTSDSSIMYRKAVPHQMIVKAIASHYTSV